LEKDTQTKLLEAATLLFAQKGFSAVSTRELAEAAGVNIAAISYHFRGKEGLYQAMMEEQFAPMSQAGASHFICSACGHHPPAAPLYHPDYAWRDWQPYTLFRNSGKEVYLPGLSVYL